jgi:hypothetical protein
MRARFLTILAVFGAAGLVMTSIAGVAAPRLSASSGKAHVMTELIARAGDAQLTPWRTDESPSTSELRRLRTRLNASAMPAFWLK